MLDNNRVASADCLPSTNQCRPRSSAIPRMNFTFQKSQNGNEETRNSSIQIPSTPASSSPSLFFTPMATIQTPYFQPTRFPFTTQSHPTLPAHSTRQNVTFKPPEQDLLDQSFLKTFNISLNSDNSKKKPDVSNSEEQLMKSDKVEETNLIDMGQTPIAEDILSGNVFELFDPLKQESRPHSWPSKLDQAGTTSQESTPTFATPTSEKPSTPVTTNGISNIGSYPFPIRLRLVLTTFPEIKPFSELVQRIRQEHQSKQENCDEMVYCKRVQRLTPQHLEQKHLPVNIYIFVDGLKEPIRLSKISLQSTVSHILFQLLEFFKFDCDQSMLKLRSREEYLRNDDVLCDMEYVYNCINSLKDLQFVLVQKTTQKTNPHAMKSNSTMISFEQFCLTEQLKTYQTLSSSMDSVPETGTIKKSRSSQNVSTASRTKTLNPNKKLNYSHQAHYAHSSKAPFLASDPRWLDQFRVDIQLILVEIERRFNLLVGSTSTLVMSEQIKLINELIGFIKHIQVTCSYIQSSLIVDKQRELKLFADQLIRKSQHEHQVTISNDEQMKLSRLLYDLIVTIISYMETYCQAYLIPYEVQIYNDENPIIHLDQLKYPVSKKAQIARPIVESSELFSVFIDSLFALPRASNIRSLRIGARLCYGNESKARQLTQSMSFSRNNYQDENVSLKPQVRFNQWLLFDDARLCELQREAILLLEIYASFIDENESTNHVEIFDGVPMSLIGWCSQALFDHEQRLINGEFFLGVFDASIIQRTGFYSLRNVYDRNCPILSVSFLDQSFFWPQVQPRTDLRASNFTEVSRDRQEQLCRLLRRPNLILNDHTSMSIKDRRKPFSSTTNSPDEEREFTEEECHLIWSHRRFIIHKPYALPKLLRSRGVWDYPSLIDIYGLLEEVTKDRTIDEIESFELLLPAFPDMKIRSFAYRSLIERLSPSDVFIYLPQLLQIIKFDYSHSSLIIEFLLEKSLEDHQFCHKFYWHLRQLLITEHLHYIRYYYLFLSLLFVIDENLRAELQREYDLCLKLKQIGLNLKTQKSNSRSVVLSEQLRDLNRDFFHNGEKTSRLPCQFNFLSNGVDPNSCSFFNSLTIPIKLAFNSIDVSGEKYFSIYKIGDDLRQDQIVVQLFSCMDKIWKANDFDFRLSLFQVVQTQERCGFIEMVTESETLREIELRSGAIKGTLSESSLHDWLRVHNSSDKEFRVALENLTYSCAAYCVATYILGIGDRHNDNIMVKQSGHLFHIDFGKYLGDTQKFGWFNRDRAPFVFTKQMLYAMSDGGTSKDALHRFVDLCCNAFCIVRENSSLLLLLISHLCASKVPNLNQEAVRFVYDRLSPSSNYAESISHFTELIVNSLNSTWTTVNFLIHTFAQTTSLSSSSNPIASGAILSFVPKVYNVTTEGRILFAQVVSYEKRTQPSKHYVYKVKVGRELPLEANFHLHENDRQRSITYHYRTYSDFYEFSERLNKQFPLIGFGLKFSRQTEDKIVAQGRVSDMNCFLRKLFELTSEVVQSDLICTFFHVIQQDQQLNEVKEKTIDEVSSRQYGEITNNNQAKLRVQLKYDQRKLYVMVRYANNLPMKNGGEPNPYCKCYLFPDERKSTKRKGKTIMNCRNPIFNETFIYEMNLEEIQKHLLRVTVWHNVLTSGNHSLGEVDIVLSQIDWSKDFARDYFLSCHDF